MSALNALSSGSTSPIKRDKTGEFGIIVAQLDSHELANILEAEIAIDTEVQVFLVDHNRDTVLSHNLVEEGLINGELEEETLASIDLAFSGSPSTGILSENGEKYIEAFAAVAEEVGNLARRVSETARQSESLIKQTPLQGTLAEVNVWSDHGGRQLTLDTLQTSSHYS